MIHFTGSWSIQGIIYLGSVGHSQDVGLSSMKERQTDIEHSMQDMTYLGSIGFLQDVIRTLLVIWVHVTYKTKK